MFQSSWRKLINLVSNGTNHVRPSQRRTALLLEKLEDRLAPAAALSAANQQLLADYGQLPLSFEANAGQTAAQVQYLARGSGYSLFLTPLGATLSLQAPEPQTDPSNSLLSALAQNPGAVPNGPTSGVALAMNLVGANPRAQAAGQNELPGTSNYFIGNDPSQWRTGVANYAQVAYQNVYPGVNLVYYGNQQQLEYDFVLAPGADPNSIRFEIQGADSISLDDQGNLVLQTPSGDVLQHAPVVYQTISGVRQQVSGQFTLFGQDEVGFQLGAYDATQPLTIDPTLSYSTYLSGSGSDFGWGIAVDDTGDAYITGVAASPNFPTTPGAYQTSPSIPAPIVPGGNNVGDAFVAKLNATGTALVYSTFIGGAQSDSGFGIAVDHAGEAYVTGWTMSNNFPTTPGAFQTSHANDNGSCDVFVTKLNATGTALIYSTYLGGDASDEAIRIALDAAGNAYVVGLTGSRNFPTTAGAFQTTNASISNADGDDWDGFVTKLNATGTGLIYSTYLGGNAEDYISDIALDSSGNAYVVGVTDSTNFPTTSGAIQTSHAADGGDGDGFVTKLNTAGTALIYSTYLGGNAFDSAIAVAVDSGGNAYVVGVTASTNFLTTAGVLQTQQGGYWDTFVTKINATGTASIYSTYLGGSYYDCPAPDIALDGSGDVYVAGETGSPNFPTTPDAFQSQLNSHGTVMDATDYDVFLVELNSTGSALLYSTFFGGNGTDEAGALAMDSSGAIYITGLTASTNLPTTASAIQSSPGNTYTSFVAKFSFADPAASFAVSAPASTVAGTPFNLTVTALDSSGHTATPYAGTIHFTSSDANAVLPADATLTNGIGTFVATLKSAGMQTIQVADVSNTALHGTVGPIAVGPGPLANLVVTAPSNVMLYSAFDFTVKAVDQFNNSLTNYTGTAFFQSSDPAAILPAHGILTNGTGVFTAMFQSPGAQTITATVSGLSGSAQSAGAVVSIPGFIPAVGVGDFNGDGKLDLAVPNQNDWSLYTFMGNGNGTFAPGPTYNVGVNPFAVATGDFNGDGNLDIVTLNAYSLSLSVLLGNGNGTFQSAINTHLGISNSRVDAMAVGDFNGDGRLDVAVTSENANGTDGMLTIFTGQGNGMFLQGASIALGQFPRYIVAGDFNHDGKLDLAVTDSDLPSGVSDCISVLLGNGNGTFDAAVNCPVPTNAGQAAVGDFNGDGNLDLAVDSSIGVSLLAGNGDGTFKPGVVVFNAPSTNLSGIAAADVNNDGRLDLVLTQFLQGPIETVLAGNGDGTFMTLQSASYASSYDAYDPIVGDFNGDGSPDVAFVDAPSSNPGYVDFMANSLITGSTTVTALPLPATHFAITGPATATAGNPIDFTVRALDATNHVAVNYSGTIHFTSSDSQAVLPGDATLTGGVGTFVVNLKSAGMQSVLAADVSNSALSGTLGPIAVSPGPAAKIVVSLPGGITAGSAFSFSVRTLDRYNNVTTGPSGNVAFSSTDPAASLPMNTTLTNGLGSFAATFYTAGNQILSAIIPGNSGPITGTATASVTAPVVVQGLIVTSLTPTPSGFVVTFNKPIVGGQINLYDTGGTLGPADVTLTGPAPSTTSVRGSLVLGSDYTSFTFVKSTTFNGSNFNPATGLLAAGTYTVSLRSASNGFEDLAGELLQTNAGSTFTTTFVVAAPAVAVGIPSFARGPGNTVDLPNNAPASAAGIPFNVSSGAGITSGVFSLTYNAALLNITGVTVNSALAGATFVLDDSSTPGDAVLSFSDSAGLPSGVLRLGSLQAEVPATAVSAYQDMGLLQIASAQLDGGAIAASGTNAVDLNAYLGDATGDGQISSGDAALISRAAVGMDNDPALGIIGGFAAYPLADPAIVGDLTSSGNVGAADVTLLNSYLAGTFRAQMPPIPTGLTIAPKGPDPTLSLPGGLQATVGSTVIVPINIDSARPAGSTGMTEAILAVKFDPAVFTVSAQDVQLGTLLLTPFSANGERGGGEGTGWQLQTAINSQTGQIGIDLFGGNALQTTSGGSLVTITLHLRQDAPAGSTGLSLVNGVNPTGQRDFLTTVSDARGALILHPALTASGTEPGIPGLVTVVSGQSAVSPLLMEAEAAATAVGLAPASLTGNLNTGSAAATFFPDAAFAILAKSEAVNQVGIDAVMLQSSRKDPEENDQSPSIPRAAELLSGACQRGPIPADASDDASDDSLLDQVFGEADWNWLAGTDQIGCR